MPDFSSEKERFVFDACRNPRNEFEKSLRDYWKKIIDERTAQGKTQGFHAAWLEMFGDDIELFENIFPPEHKQENFLLFFCALKGLPPVEGEKLDDWLNVSVRDLYEARRGLESLKGLRDQAMKLNTLQGFRLLVELQTPLNFSQSYQQENISPLFFLLLESSGVIRKSSYIKEVSFKSTVGERAMTLINIEEARFYV